MEHYNNQDEPPSLAELCIKHAVLFLALTALAYMLTLDF